MKPMRTVILLSLCAALVCSCTMVPVSEEPVRPKVEFQEIDPEEVNPASQLAIITFELVKRGMLGLIPNVRVNPQGKRLENKTDYNKFLQRNVMIVDSGKKPDGIFSQTMLSESVDKFGRIDLSRNRITYKLREPEEKEVAALEDFLVVGGRAAKGLDEQFQNDFKNAVIEYQKAEGLNPDGIVGMKTAESLAQETMMLEIQELTSHIFYPQVPRHAFFLLDLETAGKNPDRFYKGFESLEEVMNNDITREEFKKLAKPEKEFVLFVYFFDRVDPTLPVNISISSVRKRRSRPMSSTHYAVPEKWPVIVESFSIEGDLGLSRLYANLFIGKKYISSHQLK